MKIDSRYCYFGSPPFKIQIAVFFSKSSGHQEQHKSVSLLTFCFLVPKFRPNMSSSFAIAMPSEHIIKEFCATNNVPSARIAKLAFAIVLHQYFDHSEFLCSDLPQTENDNGARAGAAKRQRVEYFPELACTTSIRTALSFKEANSPLENHSKTLLFNHQNTTSLENGPSTNGQLANLIISKTGISSIDPSIPTISQDHVS